MNQDAVPEALRAGFGAGFFCGSSFFLFVVFVFLITTPWLKCFLSNANVPVWWILGMRLRGSPVGMLVDTQIALVQSGFDVNIRQVECAYLANRHRILQPGDLFEIVKQGLQEKESPPPWLKPTPPRQVGQRGGN